MNKFRLSNHFLSVFVIIFLAYICIIQYLENFDEKVTNDLSIQEAQADFYRYPQDFSISSNFRLICSAKEFSEGVIDLSPGEYFIVFNHKSNNTVTLRKFNLKKGVRDPRLLLKSRDEWQRTFRLHKAASQ